MVSQSDGPDFFTPFAIGDFATRHVDPGYPVQCTHSRSSTFSQFAGMNPLLLTDQRRLTSSRYQRFQSVLLQRDGTIRCKSLSPMLRGEPTSSLRGEPTSSLCTDHAHGSAERKTADLSYPVQHLPHEPKRGRTWKWIAISQFTEPSLRTECANCVCQVAFENKERSI